MIVADADGDFDGGGGDVVAVGRGGGGEGNGGDDVVISPNFCAPRLDLVVDCLDEYEIDAKSV